MMARHAPLVAAAPMLLLALLAGTPLAALLLLLAAVLALLPLRVLLPFVLRHIYTSSERCLFVVE